jgi:hypothetical protein
MLNGCEDFIDYALPIATFSELGAGLLELELIEQ